MAPATWDAALDDLEQRLEVAERLVADADAEADALPDWEPPALGALPRQLAERAQRLLDRHALLIGRIQPLVAAARQQHQVGQRIGQATTRPTTPVYVDVTA